MRLPVQPAGQTSGAVSPLEWPVVVGRWMVGLWRFVVRRVRRHTADRQALLREGSEVVTPVIQFVGRVGTIGATTGTDDAIRARITEWHDTWDQLGPRLLTYANQHPSDEVHRLGGELHDMVGRSMASATYLSHVMRTPDFKDAFDGAHAIEQDAAKLAERLMEKIRHY